MSEPPRRGPHTAFEGAIVKVVLEDAQMPDGQVIPFEVVHHPGGAGVVALDDQERVCLVRQYRPVADAWLWEVPAGKLEHGDPDRTARLELAEETGLRARHWQSLGAVHSSPGIFTEVIHLYLARDLEQGERHPEPGEVMEVHWLALEDAVERALHGEISDAKTVIALLRAHAWRQTEDI
ncbi:MAG: NUDIX hydrolase [Pseudomonadota bacterium]